MHDIRQLLDTARGDAPPPRFGVDDIVAAGHRRQRWVSARRIGGAAVAAVAMVTAVVLVGSNLGLSRHQAPRAGVVVQPAAPTIAIPPLTFMFGPYSVGAVRVLPPQEVTTTYQSANVVTDYRDSAGKAAIAYLGTLTVYRPGVRPPAIFLLGTKVTVHGLSGFANEREQDGLLVANGGGVFANTTAVMANTLSWQYAANSWAVINSLIGDPGDASRRLTAADERGLADKFSFGTPSRARMPFQVGYLPAGWQVVSVTGRSFTADDVAQITVIFAPPSAAGTDKIRHFADTSDGTAVAISIMHQQSTPVPDAPKTKNICTPMDSSIDLWCSWNIPHTPYFVVLHDPATTLSTAELIRIGQGLVFDNLDKPSSWHPVP